MNFEANTSTTHLTVYRGIALTTGFLAIFITPFLESVVTDLHDPLLPRYLVGVVAACYFVASFCSQWVIAHMQKLMIPFAYMTGAWLLYLTHVNDFVPAIAYSVFEILVGGSVVFISLRSLGLFLVFTCGTTMVLLQSAQAPDLHKEMYLSTLVIVALLIFLVSFLRHKLYKELRKSARLMQSVFNNSADALVLLEKGEVIGSSARSLEMFGLASADELSAHLQGLIVDRARYIDHGKDVLLKTRSDESLWVEVVVSKVNANQLELIRLTDVSERRKSELELTQAVTAAEKALSARRDLLTTVSHELRTPLNGVIGTARLLAMDCKDSSSLDLIHLIERSGNRLLASIDNILTYAELDSGTLDILREPFDLQDCVDRALASVAEQSQQKNLQLQTELAIDCTERVGDADRVSQVLERLLHNAVKFTKTGFVRLQVTMPVPQSARAAHAGTNGPDTDRVEFTVIDSGIGIDPEMMQELFEGFTQGDATDARIYEGVGLGLAICSRLVNRMDGELHCSSDLGEGTKFSFSLSLPMQQQVLNQPLSNAQTSEVRASKVHSSKVLAEEQTLQQMREQRREAARVLLVEDNEINQKITLLMLEKLGYAADLAEDGFEAIEFCKTQAYDVILMDLQMPKMGGLEATAALRNQQATRSVPIIALTANAQSSDRERCIAAGMNDFLTKPAKLATLGDHIEKYLSVS